MWYSNLKGVPMHQAIKNSPIVTKLPMLHNHIEIFQNGLYGTAPFPSDLVQLGRQ